jgi:hypothetical protein
LRWTDGAEGEVMKMPWVLGSFEKRLGDFSPWKRRESHAFRKRLECAAHYEPRTEPTA